MAAPDPRETDASGFAECIDSQECVLRRCGTNYPIARPTINHTSVLSYAEATRIQAVTVHGPLGLPPKKTKRPDHCRAPELLCDDIAASECYELWHRFDWSLSISVSNLSL